VYISYPQTWVITLIYLQTFIFYRSASALMSNYCRH